MAETPILAITAKFPELLLAKRTSACQNKWANFTQCYLINLMRKESWRMPDQMPFGTNDFANNPEPRCPCILLLDTSGSMNGEPINQLNLGVSTFKDAIMADSLASKRVETAVVLFGNGNVHVASDFSTVDMFNPPTITAGGDTPMGAGILQGIELLKQRKEQYKSNGISFFRPWIFLITDGAPTDEWQHAAAQVKQGEDSHAFVFFVVGVEGANFEILKQISVAREPLKLTGLRFQALFAWLSQSLKSVSRSSPGDSVPLASPSGWASV
jgi:uncharacterized protein YegL